jgi:hypothetical protein
MTGGLKTLIFRIDHLCSHGIMLGITNWQKRFDNTLLMLHQALAMPMHFTSNRDFHIEEDKPEKPGQAFYLDTRGSPGEMRFETPTEQKCHPAGFVTIGPESRG